MTGKAKKTAHWRQVDQCFDEVLDAPASEREAVLESMLGKYSRSVVAEVGELIASLDSTHSIFAESAPAQVDVLDADARPLPEKVGRWQIRERLGSGGQGQVFIATKQAEQFEQTGALKILSDHFSPSAMQRFLRERQTLARLRHPNIAVLLDAGASEDGRPYLVSEFIQGQTLDRYVDSTKPSPVQCVKLLLPIVEAVAYAHQQFVLHRDIKPANIIVDQGDVPYLLDFGVSAALADAANDTNSPGNPAPYTPGYAAPEQITNSPVDVRTDCWALGAVLYRALAGRSPFDAGQPRATIDAVLHEKVESPGQIAELNAIVAKCLEKSIEARYEDIGQLRDDLQAWLNDEPVRAASNSRWYLAGKWLKRHRLLTAAAALFALSLIVGAGVSSYQAQRAAEQRDRASAAAQRYQTAVGLLVDVFNGANPALQRGETPSAKDLLAEAYSRVSGMDRQPGVQAALAHELAAVFLNRGEAEKAAKLSAYAAGHFESTGEVASETYANTLVSLATAEKMLGRYRDSAENFERSLRVQREHLWPITDWRYAYTQNMLGSLRTLMGSHVRAAEIFRSAMLSLAASPEAPAWLAGTVTGNYWEGQFRLGKSVEASQALAKWIDEHVPGASEEPAAYTYASLGEIALFEGNYRDAQGAYSEAGRLLAGVYGNTHRDVLLFRERAAYSEVLSTGELTPVALEDLSRLQDHILESKPKSGQIRLKTINQRLSLTPYVHRKGRADWVNGQIKKSPVEPVSDRLVWHQHLLLRALGAHFAGLERSARDALDEAAAVSLYETPQSKWQRDLQKQLAAFLAPGGAGACHALRASLDQPLSAELAISARGLTCRRRSGPDRGAWKSVLEAVGKQDVYVFLRADVASRRCAVRTRLGAVGINYVGGTAGGRIIEIRRRRVARVDRRAVVQQTLEPQVTDRS